jgi:NADPH:quinone reductase-like Zn-dependent oxidoreductase
VKDATGGHGADVVLDLVGGAYTAESVGACATRGRIVLVGLTGGPVAEMPLGDVLRKRITLVGTVLRARPLEEKIEAARMLERNIAPWLAEGRVKSVVDRVFPLAEAGAAHAYVAANVSFGKVILTID